MIYFIVIILIIFGIYNYDYKKNPHFQLAYWILICIILICIAGFRYRLGGDTPTYMADYKTLHPISQLTGKDFQESRFAPGYIILTSVFKEITPSFYLFQFFHSLIFNGIVFLFFYRYSKHKFVALLIYFFYLYFIMSFQQLREALAVAVFLMAWPAFRDGKWLWWYLASCLAICFHVSASLMFILPAICLPGLRQVFIFGKRTILFCILFFILGYYLQKKFFTYIQLLSISEGINERAKAYDESVFGSSSFNLTGIIVFIIDYALYPFVFLCLYYGKKFIQSNNINFDKFIAFVICSFYVTFFTLEINIIGRYNNYFFPFVIVFMSNFIFSNIKIGYRKVRLNFVTWALLLLPLFAIQTYNNYFNRLNKSGTYRTYMYYYPYNSIFNEEKDIDREKTINYMRRHF